MGPGGLILVGGGVRSGKSAFALALARTMGARRAFVATAELYDDEMRARACAHVAERGASFTTVEEPRALGAALAGLRDQDVVVVDCLTLWLSNLLLGGADHDAILVAVDEVLAGLAARGPRCIVVSNEVGMGVVPDSHLGRAFRDVAGRAHQRFAAQADAVYVAMMGLMVRAKPGPFEVVEAPR